MQGSDIEVEVNAGARPGEYTVRMVNAVGGGEPIETLNLDVDELISRREQLAGAVLSSSVRAHLHTAEQLVRQVGRQLFEALFTGPVYEMYRARVEVGQQQGKRLRVVLRLNAPELTALPWEMLFDPETQSYLCRPEPLVRHVHASYTADPLGVRGPLRILGLVASPRGLPVLDVEAEEGHLAEALAKPIAEGTIKVAWVPEATWNGAIDQLLLGKWHVLHFIGHGHYDTTTHQGILALVGRDGQADLVKTSRLVHLLQAAQTTPRLVILDSRSTGQAGAHDQFSSVAAALVHNDIQAVVAMQFTISEDAASHFARGFYTALAAGRGIEEAMRSGRNAIMVMSPGTLEWVTPVLYLRGDATHLFRFTENTAASSANSLARPKGGADEPQAHSAAPRPHDAEAARPAQPTAAIPDQSAVTIPDLWEAYPAQQEARQAREQANRQAQQAPGRGRAKRERSPAKQLDYALTRAIKAAMKPGLITFNPPAEMTQGRWERVEVGIGRSPNLHEALAAGLRGRGKPQFERINTSPIMSVELSGHSFKVEPLSPAEQLVPEIAAWESAEQPIPAVAFWEFNVMPYRAGIQILTLSVSLRIDPPKTAGGRIAVPVLEREIKIQIDIGFSTRRFLADNWQWLIATTVALGGALAAWVTLFH